MISKSYSLLSLKTQIRITKKNIFLFSKFVYEMEWYTYIAKVRPRWFYVVKYAFMYEKIARSKKHVTIIK